MNDDSSWEEMRGCFFLQVILPIVCSLPAALISLFIGFSKDSFFWCSGILYVISIIVLRKFAKQKEKRERKSSHQSYNEIKKIYEERTKSFDVESYEKPQLSTYTSHCFKCRTTIDSKSCQKCFKCRYYKCSKCGVCFCDLD